MYKRQAHDWLVNVYEPTVRAVPRELRGKLEAAEVFHEVLEHRWYLSERAGRDLPLADTIQDYVRTVLPTKPDESAVLGIDTRAMPVLGGDLDLDGDSDLDEADDDTDGDVGDDSSDDSRGAKTSRR